jgi:hypothetical protein
MSSLDNSASLLIWTVAEIAVTIMAASLPVLRVLFRDARLSTRRYYATDGTADAKGSRFGQSQHQRVKVTTGLDKMRDGDGSKDIILSDMPGHIIQRTDVEVEYHTADRPDTADLESYPASGKRR